jgi:hypothetical protein
MPNPFFYGNPVPPDQLIDRRKEIRRIVGRIVNQGQSTAIVGEPRVGKTSLLLYLAAPEKRRELYGEEGENLLFSYLDAQTFGIKFNQSQFWEQALRPLDEIISADSTPVSKEDVPQEKTPPAVLSRLRRNLDEYFNDEEIRSLCADLNVDYDDLPTQGKEGKIRELVAYLDRRLRIPELSKKCTELRPKATWGIPSQVQLAPLAQAYQVCKDNSFGAFVLERLLAQMNLEGWRLVPLLDEFDSLLHHPTLNNAEFFGSLRSLASRSRGALALVIASRHSLTNLNENTFQFSRGSSPYFNFLDEITLGPWPENAVDELLQLAGDLFTPADRRFIAELAGAQPYLLQAAAAALWEAYINDGNGDDPLPRWQQASQSLYDEAAKTIGDTWQHWSPELRQAFMAVVLAHISTIDEYAAVLKHHKLEVKRLARDLFKLKSELDLLDKLGFIKQDQDIPGGWRVRPGIFLWWLTSELSRVARREATFDKWWQEQQMEGLLTRSEKQKLGDVARSFTGLLKQGALTFVPVAAKGAGEAMVKKQDPKS